MDGRGLVSDEQVEFYRVNGFVVLGALTDEAELADLRVVYDRLFADRLSLARGESFDLSGESEDRPALPQILGPSRFAPELKETKLWANARLVASRLLGINVEDFGDHAILKPAGYGAPTPWHQDEAYWDPALHYDSLSIWIPLQEAMVESGCMHFLPGTHLSEVLPHRPIGDDPKVHGLELAVDLPEGLSPVACPLPAGACTVHHNRTLHYAGANRGTVDRRALILGAGRAATARGDGRRFEWQERQKAAGAPAS